MNPEERAKKLNEANEQIEAIYRDLREQGALTAEMPVGKVLWVPVEKVRANDYNPNAVAGPEMTLLYTSISEDGYTQPVVTIYDPEVDKFIVVDGYHRYTIMRKYADIQEQTGAHLPVVVIEKDIADRIASTVRHNRARGKHSVQGMGNLVFQMLNEGEDDAAICRKIGVDAEELARLKHVTGFSALFKDHKYKNAQLTEVQVREKSNYKKEHPDEHIPEF